MIKLTAGRPRPGNLRLSFPSSLFIEIYGLDILDRCQPPAGLSDPPYKLSNSTICTQTNIAIMRDGFRSFPSGHSSGMFSITLKPYIYNVFPTVSFAGLGFLAFYLAGKLHLFNRRGHAVSCL